MTGKWQRINGEMAHQKIIGCTNITELKNQTNFYTQQNASEENKLKKMVQGLDEAREEKLVTEILTCAE